MRNLSGKVAVVTGGGSGVGKALCEALCKKGASVIAMDIRADSLAPLVENFPALESIALDVSDRPRLQAAIREIHAKHGRLDYLFNNAGILMGGETQHMSDAQWNRMLGVNLHGVIYGTQVAYEIMLEQGYGHIINTSSTAGIVPVCQSAAYTCCKFGVVGLSLSLAQEARRHGVRVSALILGAIDTNIFGSAVNLADYRYDRKMSNPLIRKISPEQAAAGILKGVARGRRLIVFPGSVRMVIWLYRLSPRLAMWLMGKVM